MTTTRALRNIAKSILENYYEKSDEFGPALGSLTDALLTALHYLVVKAVCSRKALTYRLRRNLYFYVEALPRVHRGIFWRVFLKYNREWATRWYKESDEVIELILGSLACMPVAKDENDSWVGDTEWGTRPQNQTVLALHRRSLDTVMDFDVTNRFELQAA